MDGSLVRVNVRAQLDVMAFMSLQRFGIHYIPTFLVGVADEGDLVAFSLDRAFQRLQWRFGGCFSHVAAFSHFLRGGSHATCKADCQCEDPELFHLRYLLRLNAP